MTIPDQAERSRAVLTDGHAFVWASAGTGKTHTLTLRALYLLLTAPFQPAAPETGCAALYARAEARGDRLRAAQAVIRRLALTTFTRKAAAEMQTRLFRYLDALASAEDYRAVVATFGTTDPQLVELVAQVLAKLGDSADAYSRLRRGAQALAELATELQVGTLHSYAAAILRRHPIAAGIPPTAQFAEDDDPTVGDPAEALVDRWWQHVGGDPCLGRQLAGLLAVAPLTVLRDWLIAIVHEPWIVRELDFARPEEQRMAEILEALRALAAHPKTGRLQLVKKLGEVVAARDFCWEKLCAFVSDDATRRGLFLDRLGPDAAKNLQAAIGELPARYRRHFASYTTLYPQLVAQCLSVENAASWAQWREFAGSFAMWADGAVVRELGLVTFDEMVRLAVRVLESDPAVRREEHERLASLLVDEFQDTDPVQLELIGRLLERESPGEHEVLGFFVGDPKQSIYRFRKADLPAIEAFVRTYARRVQAAPDRIHQFRLTTSFRSLEPITDFVNDLFETRVPLPGYAQEKLVPSRGEAGEIPEWRVLRADAATGSAAAKRVLAAGETARLIEEYKRRAATGDQAYKDVVVLVNTHEELETLVSVLEAAGVPAVSSGAKTFYQRAEVLDVLNLLIALHNPQDALAVGALLRSPLFGLPDSVIYRLLQAVKTPELFGGRAALPVDLRGPARQRIEAMRRLVGGRAREPLAVWLGEVRGFVPAAVYARQDAEGRAMVRVDRVLAAYGSVVALGRIPPLVWLLEQRTRADRSDAFGADLGEDISVTDDSMAAVRVMTIHKAKGLQGKFVIVYGWQKALDRRHGRVRSKPIVRVTRPDGATVCGFRLPWGAFEIVSPGYGAAERLDRQLETEEAVRLAYVAATRAEDRLVLVSPDPTEVTEGLLAAAAEPFVSGQESVVLFDRRLRVTFTVPAQGPTGQRPPAERIADEAAQSRLWHERAAALGKASAPLLYRPSEPDHPEEEDPREVSDLRSGSGGWDRELAMAAGTLVHAYLERYVLDDRPDTGRLVALEALLNDWALRRPAVDRAGVVLRRFYDGQLGGPDGRSYRDKVWEGKILGRELPVYLSFDGRAWNGVIDLVFEEEGMVCGVDYKVRPRPATIPDSYRQQQRVYTVALERLFPARRVAFEFWWLG